MIDEPYVRALLHEGLPAGNLPSPQLRERIRLALIDQPRPGADRVRHVVAGALAIVFGLLMIAVLIGIRTNRSFDHVSPATTAPAHTQMPSPQSSPPADTPDPKATDSAPPAKECTLPDPEVCVPPPPKVIAAPDPQPSGHGSLP